MARNGIAGASRRLRFLRP